MNARERILAKLQAAAPATALPAPNIYLPPAGTSNPSDPIERFTSQLRAMRADVIESSSQTWPAALEAALRAKGIRHLLLPPARATDPAVLNALPESTIPVHFERPAPLWKSSLFHEMDAGLSFASCGIAALGAIAIRTNPNEPRSLSLVPPHHFILLHADRIYPTLLDAAHGEAWADDMPSNLVFISGPSKTSDIQQTLAFGAHGPKTLTVLLVRIEPEARSGALT